MNPFRTLCLTCSVSAALFLLGSCAEDFAPNPNRPHPTGAVESPTELNSASGEIASQAAPATPIASVDFPNKGEQPKVHTILDPIFNPPKNPPATPPAVEPTAPALTEPAHRKVDPITGQ